MSRKHYTLIAANFRKIADLSIRRQAALGFADVAIMENSSFDKARFFEACGLKP